MLLRVNGGGENDQSRQGRCCPEQGDCSGLQAVERGLLWGILRAWLCWRSEPRYSFELSLVVYAGESPTPRAIRAARRGMEAKPTNSTLMIQARRVDNASLTRGNSPLRKGITHRM